MNRKPNSMKDRTNQRASIAPIVADQDDLWRRIACSILRRFGASANTDTISDTVQEFWSLAHQKRQEVYDTQGHPTRAAFGLVKQAAARVVRGQRKTLQAPNDVTLEDPCVVSTPIVAIQRFEAIERLRAELAQLPADVRCALVEHHCLGLTIQQIAASQGVSYGKANMRLFAARARLRDRLNGIWM